MKLKDQYSLPSKFISNDMKIVWKFEQSITAFRSKRGTFNNGVTKQISEYSHKKYFYMTEIRYLTKSVHCILKTLSPN